MPETLITLPAEEKQQERDRFDIYVSAALTGLTSRGTPEDEIGRLALRIGAQCYYEVNVVLYEYGDRKVRAGLQAYQTLLVDKAMPWGFRDD